MTMMMIWFGSRGSLRQLKSEDRAIEIGPTVVQPVCDFGILFDSEPTMKKHVSRTVSSCFYQLLTIIDNNTVGQQLQYYIWVGLLKQMF